MVRHNRKSSALYAIKVRGPQTNNRWELYWPHGGEGGFYMTITANWEAVSAECRRLHKKHPDHEYNMCEMIPAEGVEWP